jgi:hypothetical protein
VPLFVLFALPVVALLVGIALMPIGLIQRYRAGTARRVARGWVANLNIAALSFSVVLFVGGAAITRFWVPRALSYSLIGLAFGSLVGLAGLALTRWEHTAGKLHYTSNRFLVLVITLVVTGRLAYGGWRLWQGGSANGAYLVESGVPGSLAAGALVLGYSLTYWIGVSRQARRCRSQR